MYDLLAISAGDSASVVVAVATVGVLLGSLHNRILNYVLSIQAAINEVKVSITKIEGRTLAIEEAVKEIKAWKETM